MNSCGGACESPVAGAAKREKYKSLVPQRSKLTSLGPFWLERQSIFEELICRVLYLFLTGGGKLRLQSLPPQLESYLPGLVFLRQSCTLIPRIPPVEDLLWSCPDFFTQQVRDVRRACFGQFPRRRFTQAPQNALPVLHIQGAGGKRVSNACRLRAKQKLPCRTSACQK